MSTSLRAKLGLGLAGALLVLGVIVALSYRSTERLIVVTREATAARARLFALEQALSLARDLETGQRGFLITGDERYLEPYASRLANLGTVRRTLDSLRTRPGIDHAGVARLDALLERKLSELAHTIQVYRGAGPEAARAIVRTDLGRLTMDSIRTTVVELEARQAEAMARIDQEERTAARRTLLAVAALAGFALVLFGAVCLLLWRAIEAGRLRERMLERERAVLDERVRERTVEVRRRAARSRPSSTWYRSESGSPATRSAATSGSTRPSPVSSGSERIRTRRRPAPRRTACRSGSWGTTGVRSLPRTSSCSARLAPAGRCTTRRTRSCTTTAWPWTCSARRPRSSTSTDACAGRSGPSPTSASDAEPTTRCSTRSACRPWGSSPAAWRTRSTT